MGISIFTTLSLAVVAASSVLAVSAASASSVTPITGPFQSLNCYPINIQASGGWIVGAKYDSNIGCVSLVQDAGGTQYSVTFPAADFGGSTQNRVNQINRNGLGAGSVFYPSTGRSAPFFVNLYGDRIAHPLPVSPASTSAVVQGMNDSGYITGKVGSHAVEWNPNGSSYFQVDIGQLSSAGAQAVKVNNVAPMGQIAGIAAISITTSHAFFWDYNTGMIDRHPTGLAGSNSSYGIGISDDGYYMGFFDQGNGETDSFYVTAPKQTPYNVTTSCKTVMANNCRSTYLNNTSYTGLMVGYFRTTSGTQMGFLHNTHTGQFYNLTASLPVGFKGYVQNAFGVNDAGTDVLVETNYSGTISEYVLHL